jgi:phospholipase C
MDFTFDRSGVRVPAIAISAWIPERTVINDEYRNTSVIATLRERWQLGASFTGRDAVARDIAPVLTLGSPRAPEDWPEVIPRPVPPFTVPVESLDTRLRGLPKAALFAALALSKRLRQDVPEVDQEADIGRADGFAILSDALGYLFPHLNGR